MPINSGLTQLRIHSTIQIKQENLIVSVLRYFISIVISPLGIYSRTHSVCSEFFYYLLLQAIIERPLFIQAGQAATSAYCYPLLQTALHKVQDIVMAGARVLYHFLTGEIVRIKYPEYDPFITTPSINNQAKASTRSRELVDEKHII